VLKDIRTRDDKTHTCNMSDTESMNIIGVSNNHTDNAKNMESMDYFDDSIAENMDTSSQVTLITSNAENDASKLFVGKKLPSWASCDLFIIEWDKSKEFNVIKDRISRENDIIRRRTYVCEHGRRYESNSNKETGTKKILCSWHVNASCPKSRNPDSAIFINTIVDEHNHELNIDVITFEQEKKFSKEMVDDIEFLTKHCRIGATIQRRYLESKYPSKPIYSKDLYNTISKFRPNAKSLLNDAAQTAGDNRHGGNL
ncbi:18098_t:CDS:2, partial [Gigaspora rosea]